MDRARACAVAATARKPGCGRKLAFDANVRAWYRWDRYPATEVITSCTGPDIGCLGSFRRSGGWDEGRRCYTRASGPPHACASFWRAIAPPIPGEDDTKMTATASAQRSAGDINSNGKGAGSNGALTFAAKALEEDLQRRITG